MSTLPPQLVKPTKAHDTRDIPLIVANIGNNNGWHRRTPLGSFGKVPSTNINETQTTRERFADAPNGGLAVNN